jgi:hypothetical protein
LVSSARAADSSRLDIYASGHVSLRVTDATGRITGYGDGAEPLQNIPGSAYAVDAIHDDVTGEPDPTTTASVEVFRPAEGLYTLEIRGQDYGAYDLSINVFSTAGVRQLITLKGLSTPMGAAIVTIDARTAPGAVSRAVRSVTLQSIALDLDASARLGMFKNRGIETSLRQKLRNADAAPLNARRNILRAMLNEVNAQNGKGIASAAADALKEDLGVLISTF